VPEWIAEKALQILDPDLRIVQRTFSSFCGAGITVSNTGSLDVT
jgi:hypothetical protein